MRNVQAITVTGPVVGLTSPIVWGDWIRAVDNMAQNQTVEISKSEMENVLADLISCEPDDFREFAAALLDKVFGGK